MTNTLIRPATPEDAIGVATVHIKTWQCAYKGQIPDDYLNSLSIEKRTATWKKQIKEPKAGTYTIVAEIDGQIVGWCTAGVSRDNDVDQDSGEIYGIYVHPDFIGQGCGSALMKHVLDILRKDGYKKATLWALDTNEKARKWYESKGWMLEGSTKIDKKDGFDLNETRYQIDL